MNPEPDYRTAYFALEDAIVQALGPHLDCPKEIELAEVCPTCNGGPCVQAARCESRYALCGFSSLELLDMAALKLRRPTTFAAPDKSCHKRPLPKREAQAALNFAKAGGRGKRGREKRIYHCPDCNAWHLTSLY